MDNPEPKAPGIARARLKLALMFGLPGLAVMLATAVYFTGVGIPRATVNRGVLVQPPRQLDEIALSAAAGKSWRYEADAQGWGMLVTGGSNCDAACRERLLLTRQVRTALGRDMKRIHRYYLIAGAAAPEAEFAAFLGAEHTDLTLLHADEAALRALLARAGDPDPLQAQPVYLVDPRGFVMMYYLPSHAGSDTIKDLRFLLRNSSE